MVLNAYLVKVLLASEDIFTFSGNIHEFIGEILGD
jgi:hypothetical protein